MGMDGSGNTLGPSLTLNLDILLSKFPESQRKEERQQTTYVIIRNISILRRLYNYYCRLGHNRVQNTTSLMTRLQFWRFIKDSELHQHGHCLPEMDRNIARCLRKRHAHQPTDRLSFQDFLSALVIIAYMIYNQHKPRSSNVNTILPLCVQNLIQEHILRHSGKVKGQFLFDPRRAINALAYMEQSWRLYRALATPYEKPPHEGTLKMRRFLFALKDLQVIGPHLQAQRVIEILASDDPEVGKDGSYNLEIEMTFLEFFEALIGCAVSFVTDEMIQKYQSKYAAPKHKRKSSSSSSTGTSRPGSARPGHYSGSRRSSKVSNRSQSIGSITEDDAASSSSSSTLVSSQKQDVFENDAESVSSSQNNSILGKDTLENDTSSTTRHIVLASVSDEDKSTKSSWINLFEDDTPEEEKIPINKPEDKEVEKREKEFNLWSSQLHLFFTMLLFPAWKRLEALQIEASKARGKTAR